MINQIKIKLRCAFESVNENIFTYYSTWYLFFLDYLPFLRGKKVTQKLRNGLLFAARLNTYDLIIINELLIFKVYGDLKKTLRDVRVIVDIGAHIGVFSVLAAHYSKKGRIYSYEPFKANYDMLVMNAKLNHFNKRINPFQFGVGKRKESRKLFLNTINSGGHSLLGKKGKGVTIRTITLKDIFISNELKTCDFLKMDCEGAELEILAHAPGEILKKIKNMAIEYHPNVDDIALKKLLEKNGFIVRYGNRGLPLMFATKK